ncbi:MAG TPA: hypothetical protein VMY69_09230 [Phycisphaerae bacterium]|nr:hypothetical protein [Phycisphaerae bacterium]
MGRATAKRRSPDLPAGPRLRLEASRQVFARAQPRGRQAARPRGQSSPRAAGLPSQGDA